MKHLDQMAERLPMLYRSGPLLRGLLSQPALQQMFIDQDMAGIQQAHFFELTRDFEEARKLADLLGLVPEQGSGLREFRSFVAAFRDAIKQHGTTTLPSLRAFVADHMSRFQQKLGLRLVSNANSWRDQQLGNGFPAFVENPRQFKWEAFKPEAAGSPLQEFAVEHQGLDPSPCGFLLKADTDAAEASPCLINLTNGSGLIFHGVLKPGQRLWLRPQGPNALQAFLEHRNVSSQVSSFKNWQPGTSLAPDALTTPAEPIVLDVGTNQLSFFPIAQFNQAGLDRFLLAMPSPQMAQGSFNQTQFNQALFHQDRRIRIAMAWFEKQRASFQVRLPMAAMLRKPPLTNEQADHARIRLINSLNQGVKRLKAAGTVGSVVPVVHSERMRQMDYLKIIMPIKLKEGGVVGKVGRLKKGASFDQTSYDDSLLA